MAKKASGTGSRKKSTTKKVEKRTQHIVICLDSSGSMSSLREKNKNGIKEYLDGLDDNVDYVITLREFDNAVWPKRITKQPKADVVVNPEARGGTALYDAVGLTIEEFYNEKEVIFLIVTDGAENSSRFKKKPEVVAMMNFKEKNDAWDFVFIGVNLRQTDAESLNIGLNKSISTNNAGIESLYKDLAKNTSTRSSLTGSARQKAVDSEIGFFSKETYDNQAAAGNENEYGFFSNS